MKICEIIILIKGNVLDWQSVKKNDTFEIFNSFEIPYTFSSLFS